jgi:NTP pyrophosphatase (non-canonical NTP hydrolase)
MSKMLNMTLAEYQARMSDTAIYKWPVIYPALGLVSEAGECLGALKKMIRDNDVRFDGTNVITDAQRANLCAELGDVLWYTTALAQDLGLTLEMVARANLGKLAARKARGKLKGSGDYR